MGKLERKKEGSGQGLTKVAQLLRDNDVQEPLKRSDKKQNLEADFLANLLRDINEREYKITETLYVDEEIKKVFSLLKQKGKIQISTLVSLILDDWLSENIQWVRQIINKEEKNRFLEPKRLK